ncbi:sugar ABC transporter permease [Alicyclobacillus cycloheptanicus]|uniref:Raffinose/stachyose/melibiose transport system permease protein n=1 Tax=Alicyclobacillus cycloheptanicus TaxID=1457 RepID=A0ABT9XI99_9BACL|nr:sugar ABC transporter permease [Alicyclobacillus cycloheptanicus]MDQ0189845.1 raffinose/stachyose/melibiose transport system permease protein [Alicyclobacillus cycloheptanicus]WDM02470.1 sugar ABC transporter permease [Alicyclobacillus cycloheptanicus]
MNNVFGGRQRSLIYLTMAPGLLVFLLFGVIPSVATLVISFTDYLAIPGVPTHFVGFANYIQLFVSNAAGLKESLLDTLMFAGGVTIFQNLIALWLANALTKKFPGVRLFRTLVFMPIVLGVTVIGLMWSLLLAPSGGPAAALLGLFGTSSAFFGSSKLAMPLVIFVQIWANLGFTTVVYIAGIHTVPRELDEAAKIDGASGWKRFWRVTFPMIAPSVTVNVILAAAGSLRTYDLIYVLTDGANHTNTLGMYMFNTAFQGSGDLGLGAAIGMLQFIITIIVVFALQRYLTHREEAMSS